jgi:hypothetical protein
MSVILSAQKRQIFLRKNRRRRRITAFFLELGWATVFLLSPPRLYHGRVLFRLS